MGGLWLNGPYLHNGSVPTLRDLLEPPAQRPAAFVRGLDVVDRTGASLGQVEGFFDAGEASVMVVAGAKRHMIPFVPAYVTAVDRSRADGSTHSELQLRDWAIL